MVHHVIARAASQGNPEYYSAWRDEGDNKVLQRILRNCPVQGSFEIVCFWKFTGMQSRKRRRISE